MSRGKRWCFTLNNPTANEGAHLATLVPDQASYLTYGREVGENGTPHLQGYVEWNSAIRFTTCKNRLGSQRFHIQIARGTAQENKAYCQKDNDFEEFGQVPDVGQGRRTDLERFYDWADEFCTTNQRAPTTPEIARNNAVILTKYRSVPGIVRLRFEQQQFISDPTPRAWQGELNSRLELPADDRKIIFVYDEEGNTGKTWFIKWFYDNHPGCQILSTGKSMDIAYAIKEETKYFLFDVPRGSMKYLQMHVLEQMKNQLIFSTKYQSQMKRLSHVPHVVVFCNEDPQSVEECTQLTADRYEYFTDFTN